MAEILRQDRWWQGRQGRTRLLIAAFATLAVLGVLLPGIFNYLLAGDNRQVVVNMRQGITAQDRETVKRACGVLPGIGVVADRGDPARQAAFPVRFRLSGSTPAEESALYTCLNGFPQLVRGFDPPTRLD